MVPVVWVEVNCGPRLRPFGWHVTSKDRHVQPQAAKASTTPITTCFGALLRSIGAHTDMCHAFKLFSFISLRQMGNQALDTGPNCVRVLLCVVLVLLASELTLGCQSIRIKTNEDLAKLQDLQCDRNDTLIITFERNRLTGMIEVPVAALHGLIVRYQVRTCVTSFGFESSLGHRLTLKWKCSRCVFQSLWSLTATSWWNG